MTNKVKPETLFFLDTESTGLSFSLGDRIVELGIVEMIDRKLTGRSFHEFVDPGMEVPEEAVAIHGYTREALIAAGNGQVFGDIAKAFLEFIKGGTLVIHNATFDMSFLDGELEAAGLPKLSGNIEVIDTLKYAAVKHPGQRNSLDALCKRYGIDNGDRQLHGALLDSKLLADVYIPLTVNQQELGYQQTRRSTANLSLKTEHAEDFSALPVTPASSAELAEHDALLNRVSKEAKRDPLWSKPLI